MPQKAAEANPSYSVLPTRVAVSDRSVARPGERAYLGPLAAQRLHPPSARVDLWTFEKRATFAAKNPRGGGWGIRRIVRVIGTLAVIAGVSGAVWVATVWVWKDPFTALYTEWEQHRLAGVYEGRFQAWDPKHPAQRLSPAAVRRKLEREARWYRLHSKRGEPIGRINVPRLSLNMVLLNGTDESTLEKGPGRDLRSHMPGEGKLVYIAGHRTTFLAPFSHIDDLRRGDPVTISLPYATFRYGITHHIIVPATDLAVLRSHGREQLALQACHPRFFATHRYIAYARPVWVRLRGGRVRYRLWAG